MTKYREVIRLVNLNLSQTNSAFNCDASKKMVNKILKSAIEKMFNGHWILIRPTL